jgi:3-hydroxyacyl-CoA dehydrogenase
MTIVKTLLAGAVLAACFAGPSYAQSRAAKGPDATPMQLEDQAKERDRENIDKQYRSALQKTRSNEPAKADDPWANMRGDADVKPKAKR